LLIGCAKEIEEEFLLMDTFVLIRVRGGNTGLVEGAKRIMEGVDSLANPISGVIARMRGGRFVLPSRLRDVVGSALQCAEATNGAFDPTVLPLVEVWGWFSTPSVPDSGVLDSALALVDWKKIKLAGDTLIVPEGMGLDLGGIAKGFAVDEAVSFLMESGVEEGMVNAGGDIRVWGDRKWKIGVRNPRGTGIIAVVELENCAIATSGDYERFFMVDGKRYHHILDGKTGFPASSGLVSVSVIAPTSVLADAYATAVFVMGVNRGLAWLESQDSIGGIVCTEDGDVLYTQDLEGRVSILGGGEWK